MPTLVGPWLAGGEARIELDYSVSYNSNRTSATISGTFYYATKYWVTDPTNNWSRSGDLGSASGSNVSIDHGSNGGRTAFHSFSASGRTSNLSISAAFWGVQAQGGATISASFSVPVGALAPYITGYRASSITANTFIADLTAVTSNGGSMTNARCRYSTAPSLTGATDVTNGYYADVPVTGLLGGTTYYFAMQVANDTYGWGPWALGQSFTTLPDVSVKVGGVWKNATPYVKVGGAWKQADRWVKVGGVWVR